MSCITMFCVLSISMVIFRGIATIDLYLQGYSYSNIASDYSVAIVRLLSLLIMCIWLHICVNIIENNALHALPCSKPHPLSSPFRA